VRREDFLPSPMNLACQKSCKSLLQVKQRFVIHFEFNSQRASRSRTSGVALNEFGFGSPVVSPHRFSPSAQTGWKHCATLFCVFPSSLKTKARAETRALNRCSGVSAERRISLSSFQSAALLPRRRYGFTPCRCPKRLCRRDPSSWCGRIRRAACPRARRCARQNNRAAPATGSPATVRCGRHRKTPAPC